MATRADVTPNRRGTRSRELVLDAAERVMAEDGYEGASVARLVEEAGIPASSIYHYFESKEGVLLAVMERGSERLLAELPRPTERIGSTTDHLRVMTSALTEALERHPNFLRILLVFATQPPAAGDGKVHAVVNRVRDRARERLREQLAIAFGDDPSDPVIEQVARFAFAAIDGAFVAHQSDPKVKIEGVLAPFAPAATAIRKSLREA